ncbi:Hypothetical predicted protein, partial [Octopus vulgaris]
KLLKCTRLFHTEKQISPLPYRATHHTSTKTRPPTPPFGPYATSNQLTTRRSASVMTILGYTSASYMTSQKQLDR